MSAKQIDIAVAMVKDAVDTLEAEGLECDIVGLDPIILSPTLASITNYSVDPMPLWMQITPYS